MHAMLSAIWQSGAFQRQVSLFGADGRDGIRQRWQHVLGLSWGAHHPSLAGEILEELADTIGIALHADGAQ
eukprot:12138604-Alexandrium_andersonii.AAC.1